MHFVRDEQYWAYENRLLELPTQERCVEIIKDLESQLIKLKKGSDDYNRVISDLEHWRHYWARLERFKKDK